MLLRDSHLPPSLPPPVSVPAEREGVLYAAARWGPLSLARLVAELAGPGRAALSGLSDRALLDAWAATVEAFLNPGSPERQALDPALSRLCGLSPEGLAAGLEAVLGGVRRGPAAELLLEATAPSPEAGPVLVVLAGNLPALAVQPLLPALVLRRPVLLKSPSSEPLFAPAFAAALARRERRLAAAVAAATWPGGDAELEAPALAGAGTVVAYGERETLEDLERRAPGKVVGYGPRTSLAVVGADADPVGVAAGLARDVALFDQRGCLSVAAVYTAGDAAGLARHLATALEELARRWPPGPADPAALAAVQQARLAAEMRGLVAPTLPVTAGTVIVEPEPALQPSPGLRLVRIHPLADLGRLPRILESWTGKLQGAALAGADAWELAESLESLGFSRLAAPGDLQSPDATWHNGGRHPLAALGGALSAPWPWPPR